MKFLLGSLALLVVGLLFWWLVVEGDEGTVGSSRGQASPSLKAEGHAANTNLEQSAGLDSRPYAGGVIRGIVVGPGGEPIEAASVIVVSKSPPGAVPAKDLGGEVLRTDPSGRFETRQESGVLLCFAPGYEARAVAIARKRDDGGELRVVLNVRRHHIYAYETGQGVGAVAVTLELSLGGEVLRLPLGETDPRGFLEVFAPELHWGQVEPGRQVDLAWRFSREGFQERRLILPEGARSPKPGITWVEMNACERLVCEVDRKGVPGEGDLVLKLAFEGPLGMVIRKATSTLDDPSPIVAQVPRGVTEALVVCEAKGVSVMNASSRDQWRIPITLELDSLPRIRLVLGRSPSVQGIVRLVDGSPVKDIRVDTEFALFPQSFRDQRLRTATSSEGGTFALAGLHCGPWLLRLKDEHEVTLAHGAMSKAYEVPNAIEVAFGGAPPPPSDNPRFARQAERSHLVLPVEKHGTSRLIDVIVNRRGLIHGEVLDGAGSPIPDEAVRFFVEPEQKVLGQKTKPFATVRTSKEGKFRAVVPAGSYTVRAGGRRGRTEVSRMVSVSSAEPDGIMLRLRRISPRTLRLKDAQGAALTGVALEVHNADELGLPVSDLIEKRVTDESGEAVFANLSPGKYRVVLAAGAPRREGFARSELLAAKFTTVEVAKGRSLIELNLIRVYELSGTLRNEWGRPVSQAFVQFHEEAGDRRVTVTLDEAGRFQEFLLKPGAFVPAFASIRRAAGEPSYAISQDVHWVGSHLVRTDQPKQVLRFRRTYRMPDAPNR